METNDTETIDNEISAYLQSEYYYRRWDGSVVTKRNIIGFNFYALLFGALWCGYRRLWAVGCLVALANTIVGISAVYLYASFGPGFKAEKEVLIVNYAAIYMFVHFPLAMFANYLFLTSAAKRIESIKNEVKDSELFDAFKLRGGGSVRGAIVMYFVVRLVSFAADHVLA